MICLQVSDWSSHFEFLSPRFMLRLTLIVLVYYSLFSHCLPKFLLLTVPNGDASCLAFRPFRGLLQPVPILQLQSCCSGWSHFTHTKFVSCNNPSVSKQFRVNMVVLRSWRPGLLFSCCDPKSLSLVYKVEVNLTPSFPYSSWWEEKWEKEKTHIPFKGIHYFFLCSHWQELNCKATFNYREAR